MSIIAKELLKVEMPMITVGETIPDSVYKDDHWTPDSSEEDDHFEQGQCDQCSGWYHQIYMIRTWNRHSDEYLNLCPMCLKGGVGR